MGKDFKAGLIAGVVLAGIALIWVATRPSLSPQARMARAAGPPVDLGPRSAPSVGTPDASSPLPSAGVPEPDLSHLKSQMAASASQPGPSPGTVEPLAPEQAPAQGPSPPDLTVYELKEPIKTTRFHIVRKGETLSAIAQQYYGSSDKWRPILAANAKIIKDANKIAPGTKLIIPE